MPSSELPEPARPRDPGAEEPEKYDAPEILWDITACAEAALTALADGKLDEVRSCLKQIMDAAAEGISIIEP